MKGERSGVVEKPTVEALLATTCRRREKGKREQELSSQELSNMEQLPKIVADRLAKAKASIHLDANVLAAFAEKSLRSTEREQVLQHLAQCSDCREVVMLSIPELATQRAPAYEPSKWLGWPVLRWGALATCVVIVGAAISLRHEWGQAPAQREIAVTQSAPAVASKAPEKATEQKASEAANQVLSAKQLPPLAASERFDSGTAKPSETIPSRLGEVSGPTSPPAASPGRPAIANSALAKAKQADRAGAEKEKDEKRELPGVNDSRQPADESAIVRTETAAIGQISEPDSGKLKDDQQKNSASSGGNLSTRFQSGERAQDKLQTANAPPAQSLDLKPLWRLTEGTLQRSLDAGRTWQVIAVSGQMPFRTVATGGSVVWVGGAAGVLYRSSDAGEHWVQVKPVSDGQVLRADIIAIEFTGSPQGKLTTSDNDTGKREVWTTSDGGDTWQKQ